jgi:hypothetical protein
MNKQAFLASIESKQRWVRLASLSEARTSDWVKFNASYLRVTQSIVDLFRDSDPEPQQLQEIRDSLRSLDSDVLCSDLTAYLDHLEERDRAEAAITRV